MILIEDYTLCPLQQQQAVILRELITFEMVTVERLIYAVWGFSPEGWDAPVTAQSALVTAICKLRKKLNWRVRIESKHNVGYSLRVLPESAGELP